MARWDQYPSWIPIGDINEGQQYSAADGVTVDDINAIISNMIYLKKYGGRINILSLSGAHVDNNTLILRTLEEF